MISAVTPAIVAVKVPVNAKTRIMIFAPNGENTTTGRTFALIFFPNK